MNELPLIQPEAPVRRRSVFARLEGVSERVRRGERALRGPNPLDICIERFLSPVRAIIDGREMLLMGNNNYLGMTHDPACIDAGKAAIDMYGAGSTASRVASGTFAEHLKLEADIADMLEKRRAVLFTTGFMANLGLLTGLMASGDLLVIDEDCHASVYDAARLSPGRYVKFRHNDPGDLDARISNTDAEHVIVVTESVFSSMGDIAPLDEIVAVKSHHNASLIVDEAHSFGLYGEQGGGYCLDAGIGPDVDVVVGTLSKAAGVIGGFAASDHPGFENLKYLARAYMFTASLPPACVGMAGAALGQIREDAGLRERLWSNIAALRQGIAGADYRLNPPGAPITTIQMDTMAQGYDLWRHLYNHGVYVNALLPPATPPGTFALRISISAAHTAADIDQAVTALNGFA